MNRMDAATLAGLLTAECGFHSVLRLELIECDAAVGRLRMALPYRDLYARRPGAKDYHGGILASALDVAGTFVSMLVTDRPTPTSSFRVDYLKAPPPGDLVVSARVLRAGRTLVTADAEAVDEHGTVVAVARGTWSVPPG